MDKLRAMQYFVKIAETKSFSLAARDLKVSQSAVSKVLTGLEEALGFSLFNRSTRRLALTVSGAAYLESCRHVLQEIEEAENTGKQQGSIPRGTLKVGLHPAFRIAFFSDIARFLEAYPDLKLETKITNSPSILLDEGFDVLIRVGGLPDSNLIARQIGWLEFVVAAAPRYLKQYGIPKSPEDLQRHRAVIPARLDEETGARWEFTRRGERRTITVAGCLSVRDGVGLPESAVSGAGIVWLYEIALISALRNGLLTPVLTDWSSPRHPVYAVFASARASTPKTRAVVDYVSKLLVRAGRLPNAN
jgi:LysR family transcriptional regulator, regulator for bpeEF and oprC